MAGVINDAAFHYMKHTELRLCRFLSLCLCIALFESVIPVAAQKQSVGLVLSGGGAKGIAHVGVIKALEENNIPIDYVVGTSMGAVVGSLYSCGYSPEEMMKLFTSDGFAHWSTGTINQNLEYYLLKPTPSPSWVSVNASLKDSVSFGTDILPSSLVNPIPMNIEFVRIFAPYTMQCNENFDNLFVPFRCVSSNIYEKHKVVLRSGILGDAVRASMSFPMVYKPIEINGSLMFDGGIYDNFPVDVMTEDFHPDIMIGVSVSGPDGKPEQNNLYSQLEDMIIQNNDYNLPAKEGIKIQVPVLQFGVLDFGKAKEIYEIGYKKGLEMVDSIKSRVYARRPAEEVASRRADFKSNTPEVVFDDVEVSGATVPQAKYIKHLFTHGRGNSPFTMDQASDAYYMAVSSGRLADLLPVAYPQANGMNLLKLKADVKRPWSLSAGGLISTSVQSMLYLSLGYRSLSFHSFDADINAWLGQSYWAGLLRARFHLPSATPSYLELEAVASRQKFYETELLFYQNSSPAFITETETFAKLNYAHSLGRHAKMKAGLGYGYITDRYLNLISTGDADPVKDLSRYKAAQLEVQYDLNTLNSPMYPSEGNLLQATLRGIMQWWQFCPGGDRHLAGSFARQPRIRADLKAIRYFPIHKKFVLGTELDAGIGIHNLNQNYTATLVQAVPFEPTPSTHNYFNPAFRADNYLAIGLSPIWKPMNHLQVRTDLYGYAPIRNVVSTPEGMARYSGWFRKAEFIGEAAVVYNFSFASLSAYVNYLSYPAKNWNFGINFGMLIQSPRFFR